jgi:hypothetical protein
VGMLRLLRLIAILLLLGGGTASADTVNGLKGKSSCGQPTTFLSFFDIQLCELQARRGDWVSTPASGLYERYAGKVEQIIHRYRKFLGNYVYILNHCNSSDILDCNLKARPLMAKLGLGVLQEFDNYHRFLINLGPRPSDNQAALNYDRVQGTRTDQFQLFLFSSFDLETKPALNEFESAIRRDLLVREVESLRQQRRELDQEERWLREHERWLRGAEQAWAEIKARGPQREEDESCEARALLLGALAGALSRRHTTTGLNTATAGLDGCR